MVNAMKKKLVLAIDLGASSGRAIIGSYDDDVITLQEVHRFSNDPVNVMGTMYWDVLRLFHEIKQSIIKAKPYGRIESIAIDTWGVDFGLLDKNGRLLENPVHYRDCRTHGTLKRISDYISHKRLYEITGIQLMKINTVFQLLAIKESRPELLESADKLLLMPDLFAYLLTGKMQAEMSIASTTQLFDAKEKCWSEEIISALGLPMSLFAPIVKSGSEYGVLSKQICAELDVEPCKVISICGHDTQSAQIAVPTDKESFAFLSCGTWSLLGTEIDNPIITEASARLNVSNETCYGGKTSCLKNIIGLWLIQESRRQWQREGKDYSYAALESMARNCEPLKCFINPDDDAFVPAGNIPERVREYCKRTNQYVPLNDGEVIRCIYDSLAMKYREAVSELEECTGKSFKKLHMVGGGTKDRLLACLTANACGITVSCGPVEATAFGNCALQLMNENEIESLAEARKVISRSEKLYYFTPEDCDKWANAYEIYQKCTSDN